MKEYRIKDCRFEACSQAGYDAIRGCYTHCSEYFFAADDQAAIAQAEFWQNMDDAAARAVIANMKSRGENTHDAEQAYDNAPCYVSCIYDAETDEPVEF